MKIRFFLLFLEDGDDQRKRVRVVLGLLVQTSVINHQPPLALLFLGHDKGWAGSNLFPLRKLRGAWPEGSGPAWGKGTEGRYPFCASRQYGGVGAWALPLGSMRYKHDSEDNEDEDTNLQKIPVYKKM